MQSHAEAKIAKLKENIKNIKEANDELKYQNNRQKELLSDIQVVYSIWELNLSWEPNYNSFNFNPVFAYLNFCYDKISMYIFYNLIKS